MKFMETFSMSTRGFGYERWMYYMLTDKRIPEAIDFKISQHRHIRNLILD